MNCGAVKRGALTDMMVIQVLTQEIYLKDSYWWLNLNVKLAKFEGKSGVRFPKALLADYGHSFCHYQHNS